MAKAKTKMKTVVKAKSVPKKAQTKPAAKSAAKKPQTKTKHAAQKKKPVAKVVTKKTSQPKKATASKPTVLKASVSKPAAKVKLVDVSEFVTPLDDRMIVQVLAGEKVTAGGIIIPDTITGLAGNRKGVVLSVGRGHRDPKGRVRPMDVQKGDRIVFPDFTGAKIVHQGEDLIILRETDVMGVLD